jgi:hypothetical protein
VRRRGGDGQGRLKQETRGGGSGGCEGASEQRTPELLPTHAASDVSPPPRPPGGKLSPKEALVLRLNAQYPGDVGVLSAFFLNLVRRLTGV